MLRRSARLRPRRSKNRLRAQSTGAVNRCAKSWACSVGSRFRMMTRTATTRSSRLSTVHHPEKKALPSPLLPPVATAVHAAGDRTVISGTTRPSTGVPNTRRTPSSVMARAPSCTPPSRRTMTTRARRSRNRRRPTVFGGPGAIDGPAPPRATRPSGFATSVLVIAQRRHRKPGAVKRPRHKGAPGCPGAPPDEGLGVSRRETTSAHGPAGSARCLAVAQADPFRLPPFSACIPRR